MPGSRQEDLPGEPASKSSEKILEENTKESEQTETSYEFDRVVITMTKKEFIVIGFLIGLVAIIIFVKCWFIPWLGSQPEIENYVQAHTNESMHSQADIKLITNPAEVRPISSPKRIIHVREQNSSGKVASGELHLV